MEFYEVVKTRRSIRSYKADEVPDDVLNRVMEAVRVAPSGSNRQPWRFLLVRKPELKQKLAELCGGQKWFAGAPIVVVACGHNINYNRGGWMGDAAVIMDVRIGLTHMVLAARAEGLGTCWIGLFENAPIKALLDIPEEWNVAAVTPLGYPKDPAFVGPGKRKGLEEIVGLDKW